MLTLVAAGAIGVRLLAFGVSAQTPAAQEVIAAIQVHGNHLSTDDEVVQISGLAIGAPFGPSTIADAASRLKASKKFQDVTVLKRFASIADASQIVVVLIVDEGPMRIEMPDTPGGPVQVVKRARVSQPDVHADPRRRGRLRADVRRAHRAAGHHRRAEPLVVSADARRHEKGRRGARSHVRRRSAHAR